MQFNKIVLIFSFLTISCSQDLNIENYLKNDLNHEIQKLDDIYILFSMNTCFDCLSEIRQILFEGINKKGQDKSKNIKLVVSGFSKKNIQLFLGKNITQNCKILYDTELLIENQSFFKKGNFYVLQYDDKKLIRNFHFNTLKNINKFSNLMKN